MDNEGFQKFLGLSEAEQKQLVGDLSDGQLKELSKAVNRIRKEQYERGNHSPAYGNLRRSFYKDELAFFFDAAPNEGIRCAFLTMMFYGLRCGELQHLEYDDSRHQPMRQVADLQSADQGKLEVDTKIRNAPKKGMLKIYQPKNDRHEWIPVHGKTTKLLENLDEFKDYSKAYLRNRFGDMREETGMTYQYGESKNGRPLYQFSTHSFRKTAITLFAKQADHELKVKEFARHKGGDVTMRYFDYDFRTWRNDLEETFDDLYGLI